MFGTHTFLPTALEFLDRRFARLQFLIVTITLILLALSVSTARAEEREEESAPAAEGPPRQAGAATTEEGPGAAPAAEGPPRQAGAATTEEGPGSAPAAEGPPRQAGAATTEEGPGSAPAPEVQPPEIGAGEEGPGAAPATEAQPPKVADTIPQSQVTPSRHPTIPFAAGKAEIGEGNVKQLQQIAKSLLNERRAGIVRIEGHSDGSEDSPQGATTKGRMALSWARAEAVRDYLVRQGVFGARLVVSGRGDQPVSEGDASDQSSGLIRGVVFVFAEANKPHETRGDSSIGPAPRSLTAKKDEAGGNASGTKTGEGEAMNSDNVGVSASDASASSGIGAQDGGSSNSAASADRPPRAAVAGDGGSSNSTASADRPPRAAAARESGSGNPTATAANPSKSDPAVRLSPDSATWTEVARTPPPRKESGDIVAIPITETPDVPQEVKTITLGLNIIRRDGPGASGRGSWPIGEYLQPQLEGLESLFRAELGDRRDMAGESRLQVWLDGTGKVTQVWFNLPAENEAFEEKLISYVSKMEFPPPPGSDDMKVDMVLTVQATFRPVVVPLKRIGP